jgi:hypothetical protein
MGARRRNMWGFDLYMPTPKYVKKACVLYERNHHESKNQFGSQEEE